jgi:MscS family membrane protein
MAAQTQLMAMLNQFVQTARETSWLGWGLLVLSIFVGVVLGRVAQGIFHRLARYSQQQGWPARATVLHSMAGPAALALITAGLAAGLTLIRMSPAVATFALHVLVLLWIIAGGWLLFNLVDLVDLTLHRFALRTHTNFDNLVVPLVRRTLRIFLVVVLALFTAENVFGADIGAWLAGLGIAGLAVSLAAQESIKNLFGSLTVFLDRPFTIGHFVMLADKTGTIEEIGFRSTRLRTVDGAVVTIPNSKVVDNPIENLTLRPAIRRVIDLTITYDTPPEKIERAVEIVHAVLAEPEIAKAFDLEKFPPRVYFDALNADSLNIKVFYWHHPPDYWQYLEHAQRVNLLLIRRFNDEGIEFAFPTRTLFLARDPKRELAMQIERDGAAGADGAA